MSRNTKSKPKKELQISFNKDFAETIYEWYLALSQGLRIHGDIEIIENCLTSQQIYQRIERFIGRDAVMSIKNDILKYPYFKKKK